jgi:valyl-tRNA synthetase
VRSEDRERDQARLRKELDETERLLASTRAKLANEAFVSRAPNHVVDGVRTTEAELQALAERLREHLGE